MRHGFAPPARTWARLVRLGFDGKGTGRTRVRKTTKRTQMGGAKLHVDVMERQGLGTRGVASLLGFVSEMAASPDLGIGAYKIIVSRLRRARYHARIWLVIDGRMGRE